MSGRGACDVWVGEVHGRSNHVVELLREAVAELLFGAPRGPPLLADIAVPAEDLSQWPQFHAAMPCDFVDGDHSPPGHITPGHDRRQVRLDQLVPAAAFSFCSTISPSIMIWISSPTTSLPSSTMLKLSPKSFRLILVVAP